MSEELEYFVVDNDILGPGPMFPFHIYVYNPFNHSYTGFLKATYPLIDNKLAFLKYIFEKGGKLAIPMNQKRTFLRHLDLEESDIPSLAPKEKTELEIEQEQREEELRNVTQTPFPLKDVLKSAAQADDYSDIIERARIEIMALPVTISPTTSLARYLAEKLLNEDNMINRVTALSYFFAKNCDLNCPSGLGDLATASLLSHIGHTQIDIRTIRKPNIEHTKTESKEYKKHPGLSEHLIKKAGLKLSGRALRIINEHHERSDGNGYPASKMADHIEPLALVHGAISHLLEYQSGKITGRPKSLHSIIRDLKEKNFTPGLETEFGELVYKNLIYLLNTDEVESEDNDYEQAA